MGEANWMCSLLCLPLLFTTLSGSCLDGTMEPLISGQVTDQSFKADSFHNNNPPHQARLEGNSWCSSNTLTASSERPWLQVTFAMDVNISIVQTGGYNGYWNYYITSFLVQIGDGTGGSLHSLTTSDDSTEPLEFVRNGEYDVEDTVLQPPIITRVLRIVAVGWIPSNQVCLRLEALGCTVPTTATEPNIEASSYTTQETPPTEEVSGTSSYSKEKTILVSPQGQSRAAIVGGVVGGGLGLLLLLVILAVAIFIFARRRSTHVQISENCEDSSEHHFDNSIYGTETPSQSLYQDIPEHKVDNSIYEDREEIKTENHLEMAVISSSVISSTYESILATTTSIREPIQDLSATLDFNVEEVQGNPIYDNSTEENIEGEYCLAQPGFYSSIKSDTYASIDTP